MGGSVSNDRFFVKGLVEMAFCILHIVDIVWVGKGGFLCCFLGRSVGLFFCLGWWS